MQNMMKQMQKMQKDMMNAQQQLNETVFTATSASNLVKISATGNKKVTDIQIDPAVLDPEDPDMLQDLLITTWNDLLTQIDSNVEQTMGRFTQGMNLPF